MLNEAWEVGRAGGATAGDAGVDAAVAHLATAVDRPVLVASRPAGPPAEVARVRWANEAAADLFGAAAPQLLDRALTRLLRPLDGACRLVREGRTRCPVDVVTADGSLRRTELVAWPVPAGGGAAEDFWVLLVVAPEDEATLAVARAAEERFATLARSSPVATVVSDVGARLSRVNDAFAQLLGRPADELRGTAWLDHVLPEERAGVVDAVARVLGGDDVALDTRVRTAAGLVRWVTLRLAPSSTPGYGDGFVGTLEDVTDRLAREHRLAYQAQHDLLTGLPNRLALLEHLEGVLAADAPGTGVLLLDLDDFKTVNDGLGPEAGDAVLVEVARRLSATLRAHDVVARPGGDEFVLVCGGLTDLAAVEATARRVLDCVLAPVEVAGSRLRLEASIGVVLLDPLRAPVAAGGRGRDGVGPDELLRDAGIAAHEAKAAGGGRWAVLDEDGRRRARQALRLVADLREALARGALDVHYQPIVTPDPAGGGLVQTVEALCRWRHPEFGPVDPGTFVALAERANLVPALDAHVLAVACRDLAGWRAEQAAGRLAHSPRRVAVNVSAVTLTGEAFTRTVRDTVAGSGLTLADVCLEVTETAIAGDLHACRGVLEALRADGAHVAIDDFGTGYSSLAYLKDLPVDHLKVDRSFVADLPTDACPPPPVAAVPPGSPATRVAPAHAVAAAVVSLAHALGLQVVAEGVETPAQDALLRGLGCEALQGWLYSRALPLPDLTELLRTGGRLLPAAAAGTGAGTGRVSA